MFEFETLSPNEYLVKKNKKAIVVLTKEEYEEYLRRNRDSNFLKEKERAFKASYIKKILQIDDDSFDITYNETKDSYDVISEGNTLYSIQSTQIDSAIEEIFANAQNQSNSGNEEIIDNYGVNEVEDASATNKKANKKKVRTIKIDEEKYMSLRASLASKVGELSSISGELNSAGNKLTGIDGNDFGLCSEAASLVSVANLCYSFGNLIEYSVNTFKSCDKELGYYFDNYLLDEIFDQNNLLGEESFDHGTKAIDIYKEIYDRNLSHYNSETDFSELSNIIQAEIAGNKGISDYTENVSNWMNKVFGLGIEQEETITLDEFRERINESKAMFDAMRQDAVDDFIASLKDNYYSFQSEAVPTSLNFIVEDIFRQSTEYKLGTVEYQKALEYFKQKFASEIKSVYGESSNILEEALKNCETEYDKALLLLSFDTNIDNMQSVFENTLFPYINATYNISDYYNSTFNIIKAGNELLNSYDFTNKDINQVIQEYSEFLRQCEFMPGASGLFIDSVNPPGYNGTAEAWFTTLKSFGYLVEGTDDRHKDIIFDNTFNDDFFAGIMQEKGIEGLQKFLNEYYSNIGLDDNAISSMIEGILVNGEYSNGISYLTNRINYNHLKNSMSVPLENLCNKKITIDSTESNYKMHLASIVDTSSVTEEDIERAKRFYGSDYKYLDEWQLRVAALAYKEDIENDGISEEYLERARGYLIDDLGEGNFTESDVRLLAASFGGDSKDYTLSKLFKDDVFYNTIASGWGEEEALTQFKIFMGFSDAHPLDNDLINIVLGELNTISFGIVDGIYSSAKGVYNFLGGADGRIDRQDYRMQYLKQLLSADYELYNDYYNGNEETMMMLQKVDGRAVYEMLYASGQMDKKTYLQYANLDMHQDNDEYIKTLANSGSFHAAIVRGTYNLSSSIGNMVIPMALSAFVSPAAMSAWLFTTTAGNEREQLLQSGRENGFGVWAQAVGKGLLAVYAEKMLGSLKGYGAKENEILGIFGNYESYSATAKFFAKLLSSQIHEVNEELFENFGGYAISLLNGETLSLDEIKDETLQTALYTFLSTPFINWMGGAMQSSDYSAFHRKSLHYIDGIGNVTYSREELMIFVKDGKLDEIGWLNYLSKNNRFEGKYLNGVSLNDNSIYNFLLSNDSLQNLNGENKIGSTDFFVDNIHVFQRLNMSYNQYLKMQKIDTFNAQSYRNLAIGLGDSKLYLYSFLLEAYDDKLNDYDWWLNFRDTYNEYSLKMTGDIDTEELYLKIEPYLTDLEKRTYQNLRANGISDILSRQYSTNQLAAIYNYTQCGGFEINGWLNNIPSMRNDFKDIPSIQDAISGFVIPGGRINRVFPSSSGDIMQELDSITSTANYKDAIVTYRGLKELYDHNIQINPLDLQVGMSFGSDGYQSSSVLLKNCYSYNSADHNIILEITVPPESGTGAYIENVTGCGNYCQTEMLIKRGAKYTVIDDVRMEMINGNQKIIIPVVVQ